MWQIGSAFLAEASSGVWKTFNKNNFVGHG